MSPFSTTAVSACCWAPLARHGRQAQTSRCCAQTCTYATVWISPGSAAPNVALRIIDRAMQVHGAGGLSDDWPLAQMYAHQRTLRLADGPDEVHKMTIARRELRRHEPDFRM